MTPVGVDDHGGSHGLDQSRHGGPGSLGSMGSTAFPPSQAPRRAATNASPAGRSSATNSGMAVA